MLCQTTLYSVIDSQLMARCGSVNRPVKAPYALARNNVVFQSATIGEIE